MNVRTPEPTNRRPVQTCRKAVKRLTTSKPSRPSQQELQRADRKSSQITRQVTAMPASVASAPGPAMRNASQEIPQTSRTATPANNPTVGDRKTWWQARSASRRVEEDGAPVYKARNAGMFDSELLMVGSLTRPPRKKVTAIRVGGSLGTNRPISDEGFWPGSSAPAVNADWRKTRPCCRLRRWRPDP